MVHHILISSYTNDISTVAFDPSAAKITLVSSTTVGHHPSWITPHPEDPTVIFTGLEQADGKVVVLKYDQDWKGAVVAEGPSGGADPCSLLVAKEKLFVANYSTGVIAKFPVSDSPPYLLAASPSRIKLEGSSINPERQESSHPHQIFYHPHGEVLVPDLGVDLVRRYKITDNGSLLHAANIPYTPGGGPRHVAFHDGDLYTLLELTSVLTKHRFPQLPAEPTFVTSTPTMSNPPPSPSKMLASEILIPPTNATFPTPYLYLSNRNDPSPGGDTIAIFSISNPDSLELIAEVKTGLNHVRGMLFGGPDDKWLVAGGANGGGIKVFERVDGGRNLKAVAENDSIKAPTGFLWV